MARRGRRDAGRAVNGILLFDKPAGCTSNQSLQRLKHLYQAKSAGHTGSLDKPATGLLPICFGQATKCSSYLLDADKTYHMFCRLGARTTTGDASGEVLEQMAVPVLYQADIEEVLHRFTGTIEQVPPMYSALKYHGRRLHVLARAGQEVVRQARPVTIHTLRLLSHTPDTLELWVDCSKGTYMRALAEDIGSALGCGAYVQRLRRECCGPFQADAMYDFDTIAQLLRAKGQAAIDALLLPPESALPDDWPEVRLVAEVAAYFRQGQAVMVPGAPTEGFLRVHDAASGMLIAIAEVQEDGRVAPRRILMS